LIELTKQIFATKYNFKIIEVEEKEKIKILNIIFILYNKKIIKEELSTFL